MRFIGRGVSTRGDNGPIGKTVSKNFPGVALLSNAPLIPQDGVSETLTSRRPSPEAWKFFRTEVGA